MQLCVALDLPTEEENLSLAKELGSYSGLWLKVGFRTFIRDGRPFLDAVKAINPEFKIFLDLKLYDIPNTMADAAEEIAKMDVDMFNIHASAGKKAMQTVMQRLDKFEKRPLVLAVTALTSFDYHSFKEIYGADIEEKAKQFALQSYQAGLDGVVCSVYESSMIKHETDNAFLTLTPGIRPFGEASDDQKRVADIETAKREKVDIIVVGRPVYKADKPAEIVEKILQAL
ncbi:orotidine-5'-phosphate decarboxylase [Hydrogenimonas cancrithermarum]|uniref:Orotidine 5'-phosphate decarboxylase n=1 Tax=Hydrogenimonas cancrithermarum TaxID=2993563 RepID=A0ABM8FPM2_9BACT|nr:orotidine-5'-phosphate decarboxylase [Hydrogenimonas cancrithermarum]BDY13736.1 orotidine 5'-phosphate decarboxylase [Hydrogenimonas cancrithermarum]